MTTARHAGCGAQEGHTLTAYFRMHNKPNDVECENPTNGPCTLARNAE